MAELCTLARSGSRAGDDAKGLNALRTNSHAVCVHPAALSSYQGTELLKPQRDTTRPNCNSLTV